jgi:hypothetical protein
MNALISLSHNRFLQDVTVRAPVARRMARDLWPARRWKKRSPLS